MHQQLLILCVGTPMHCLVSVRQRLHPMAPDGGASALDCYRPRPSQRRHLCRRRGHPPLGIIRYLCTYVLAPFTMILMTAALHVCRLPAVGRLQRDCTDTSGQRRGLKHCLDLGLPGGGLTTSLPVPTCIKKISVPIVLCPTLWRIMRKTLCMYLALTLV